MVENIGYYTQPTTGFANVEGAFTAQWFVYRRPGGECIGRIQHWGGSQFFTAIIFGSTTYHRTLDAAAAHCAKHGRATP